MSGDLIIRPEGPTDPAAIAAVHRGAFAEESSAQPAEVALVEQLRRDPNAWIPGLSLVAITDEGLVGHVVCSRAAAGQAPALGLGPIGVRPDVQRRGIGTALMTATIHLAREQGETVICLLGDPGYYQRFGFRTASDIGIIAPDPGWGEHFMALPLTDHAPPTGRFAYATAFGV